LKRSVFDTGHHSFRRQVVQFIKDYVLPNADRWRENRIVDRELFQQAATCGLIGLQVPTQYGGRELSDYRYNQVVLEEFEAAGVGPCGTGIMLQNDIILPYLTLLARGQQHHRWLPAVCAGQLIGALAITEPQAGSDIAAVDTSARRVEGGYVLNEVKTYIGCGISADIVLVVARTDPARHHGLSILVVERTMDGFTRGRNLPRAGREAQDVGELFFRDVFVPARNLLSEEGAAFGYLMRNLVTERMQVAVSAVAACRFMLDTTLTYVKSRHAFGMPVGSFQHNKFLLAELATEIEIAQTFVDRLVQAMNAAEVEATDAAMAKWWCTELQNKVAVTCLQMHGGAGYTEDLPITRSWRDARVTTVYGGTTEIMKEIIGRRLGL
jgi:alkylation response protein AidB-like acyl-CoA dehydrogenase